MCNLSLKMQDWFKEIYKWWELFNNRLSVWFCESDMLDINAFTC